MVVGRHWSMFNDLAARSVRTRSVRRRMRWLTRARARCFPESRCPRRAVVGTE